MKINFLTFVTFFFGLISGVAQWSYWFGWPIWMSDASLETPAFYLIFFPFVFWFLGMFVVFGRYGSQALWTLLPALFTWLAPAFIISLIFAMP